MPSDASRKRRSSVGAVKAASTKSQAQRKTKANDKNDDNGGSRQRFVEAAIRCILERGFYRASSNAIAQTAGLSWGVIQYHFGTREALMMAVLEEGHRRLLQLLTDADITADTMPERLEQYFDVLQGYYGQEDYLAFIQVLLNLSHDPDTSEETLETMSTWRSAINTQMQRLTRQLFAGTAVREGTLTSFPFNVLRGMALSEVMMRTVPYDAQLLLRQHSNMRPLLAHSVSLLLESEGIVIKW
jgi:AcrR family transcriptional regulator